MEGEDPGMEEEDPGRVEDKPWRPTQLLVAEKVAEKLAERRHFSVDLTPHLPGNREPEAYSAYRHPLILKRIRRNSLVQNCLRLHLVVKKAIVIEDMLPGD
ncbi:hypothetical protein [Endozoicomonas sp. ONNA2]|uniref:hypothetical protein n=1 Tax=Endozoicomonas sp. ONNA2 TaxID=2828741 RepID=UPI0021493930|nr:hypothetical protein [Endozoicomonas sp. ONNA2]